MRSRGWYDGSADFEIDSTKKPALVSMKVTRGTRYVLARVEVEGLPPEAASLGTADGLASLGVPPASPALAEGVLAAEKKLLLELAARGYPYAILARHDARIDRRAHTMELVLRVDAGPLTRFGEVTVEGLKDVDRSYVLGRMKFEKGQVFAPDKVDESRKALFASGVFSGVGITWGTRADVGPHGEAPIRVSVTEGKFHSIGAGLKYSSADGFGGTAFWEDRNLLGGAERLRAEVEVTQLDSIGGVSFRQPDFLSRDQSLLLDAKADVDKPPAYDRYALSASAGLERMFAPHLVGTGGLTIEQSDVNSAADADGTRRFTLIGLPLGLRYDGSDSLLDPTRGHRTFLSVTPWASVLGDTVELLVMRGTESLYVPLDAKSRVVWATRFTLGSVVGAERIDIPADKRMYAGGGDSVRGYEYQFVGPLRDIDLTANPPTGKPDWKPEGGRSLVQSGTELRWKVTETIGLVPFVEGAGVYESSYPDFGTTYRWAGGLGLRYFTVAGPLRLDLGFPINPRQSDSIFQVYISLGQAF